MDRDETADDRAIVDGHVPRHLHPVRHDHVVADHAVVGDVDVRHQKAPLADGGFAGRGAAAIDGRVFANDGAATDFDPGLFALVLEILRVVADHGAVADLDAFPDAGVALEHRVRRDGASVADRHLGADDAVRPDRDVGAELGGRIDQRSPMDHLSTTIAIISASATTCPSTNPAPFIRHVLPRNCTISSSKRIWSPGTTGRRYLTLSSDMK